MSARVMEPLMPGIRMRPATGDQSPLRRLVRASRVYTRPAAAVKRISAPFSAGIRLASWKKLAALVGSVRAIHS